jgi:arsenite methyltransferase
VAAVVGDAGYVLGIDISQDLLMLAQQRNDRAWLAYSQGDARALCVADQSFDVAVSAQVLEYVEEPTQAISEMYRVLRPGGRAVIMNTDWDRIAWYSDDPLRMAKIRKAWEAHCVDPRLPQKLIRRLRQAGFEVKTATTFPIVNTRATPDTYSHGLIDLIVGFIRQQGTVAPQELDAWAAELRVLSAQGRYFFSTTRCFFRAIKPTRADTQDAGQQQAQWAHLI